MNRKQHNFRGLIALALCACLVVGMAVPVQAFSFFTTKTKWSPGANAATSGIGFYGTPGGATFSVMGAGFSGDPFDHGANLTAAITSLGVAGFVAADYAATFNWALNAWASVSFFTNLGQVADGGVNAGAADAAGGNLGDIRFAAWELVPATTLEQA